MASISTLHYTKPSVINVKFHLSQDFVLTWRLYAKSNLTVFNALCGKKCDNILDVFCWLSINFGTNYIFIQHRLYQCDKN